VRVCTRRFGLSYTTFALSDLVVSPPSSPDTTLDVVVSVTITNTGARAGAGVAQLYVTYPDDGVTHPPLQLKAFAKAHGIAPGATRRVEMRLDKYAVSYWQEAEGCWKAQQGTYLVRVGESSESLCLARTFDLEESFTWKGL
jgi:beta-glucosidase